MMKMYKKERTLMVLSGTDKHEISIPELARWMDYRSFDLSVPREGQDTTIRCLPITVASMLTLTTVQRLMIR